MGRRTLRCLCQMQFLRLKKNCDELVSIVNDGRFSLATKDMQSNIDKLTKHALQNPVTDVQQWADAHRHLPLSQEHPLCWLLWLQRGVSFIHAMASLINNDHMPVSSAAVQAYQKTLKEHHAFLIQKAAQMMMSSADNNMEADWVRVESVSFDCMRQLTQLTREL